MHRTTGLRLWLYAAAAFAAIEAQKNLRKDALEEVMLFYLTHSK
jgi:hypothetical protein